MKYRALLAVALFALSACGRAKAPTITVANLPFCGETAEADRLYLVTDAVGADRCDTGGGNREVLCVCKGGEWEPHGHR